MALYEYRCQVCDTAFEARRPMTEADTGVTCPDGHTEVRRLLSVFATVGGGDRAEAAPMPTGGGGGCCGGGCGCG